MDDRPRGRRGVLRLDELDGSARAGRAARAARAGQLASPGRPLPPAADGARVQDGSPLMDTPERSFDRVAEEYERLRPDYPDAVLELVPLSREATVLDVGAGTGKLTRVLARRYARVIAVEPLDGMRAVLERVVPEVEARKGSAEAVPL